MALPVIGLTGEYASGKTVFGLTIAPPEATLVYDMEKSSASYESMGFTRRDVPSIMLARGRGKPFLPIDLFRWWRDDIRQIEPGRYQAVLLDTASEIESGLCDYVYANPNEFGRTKPQYITKSNTPSPLFWGDVKEHLKFLLTELSSRVETFAFTVHLKSEFVGGVPTTKKKPKGKTTLEELASLFLWLERKPNARGEIQAAPSALVRKTRLLHTHMSPAGMTMIPVLPPRLPVATPAAIRAYMLNPPDPAKLKPEELAPEEVMSEDERLELRAQIAANEAEARRAELEMTAVKIVHEGYRSVESKLPPVPAPTPPPKPAAAPSTNGHAAPAAQAAPGSPQAGVMDAYCPPIDDMRLGMISDLRDRLFALDPPDDPAMAWQAILGKRGVKSARDMNAGQADILIEKLTAAVREMEPAAKDDGDALFR
jgi:hypothetical protein